jgi:DNA replication protein DnaC
MRAEYLFGRTLRYADGKECAKKQKGGCCGSRELENVVPRRPWHEIFYGKRRGRDQVTSHHNRKLNMSEGQLEPLFRRLNLAHTRRIYQDVADRAEKENWSYRDFLALLLAEEVAHRKQTRLQRFTRKAHFPFFKTIDEFDFSLQKTLRQSLLGSYLGPDFVTEGRSLILYGKAGRGKTQLAVAIGYRAIQNGFETLCTTAAELVEELSNASQKGRLQESLLTYTRPTFWW